MRLIMRLICNAISLRVWPHCKLVWKIRQLRKFGRKLNKKRRTRPFLVIVKNSVLHTTLLYYKPLFSIPLPVPNNRLLGSLFTVYILNKYYTYLIHIINYKNSCYWLCQVFFLGFILGRQEKNSCSWFLKLP